MLAEHLAEHLAEPLGMSLKKIYVGRACSNSLAGCPLAEPLGMSLNQFHLSPFSFCFRDTKHIYVCMRVLLSVCIICSICISVCGLLVCGLLVCVLLSGILVFLVFLNRFSRKIVNF